MRAMLIYTSSRFLLFIVVAMLLYLAGARGILLIGLALLASGLISFVVLSRQRDAMSGALSRRLRSARERAGQIGDRIDVGARAEDDE